MPTTPEPVAGRSSLLQRMWFAFRTGLQFNQARDLYSVYGYPKTLTAENMIGKYERQDIAARIVDEPPEETWTNPPTLKSTPEFMSAWERLLAQVDLWPVLTQADKLCCFGSFAGIWMGLPGDPAQPINSARVEDLMYLSAWGGSNITVDSTVTNATDPRFGQPAHYSFILDDANKTVRVHWSRVIHVCDRPVQGKLYGKPRLMPIYNLLEDISKIAGGSAETFWLTANRGMQVDVDKDMELNTDDAQQLSDELEEFQHQLRRYIRTRGVKITNLGSDVADPRGVFEVLVGLLAGATGIPQRVLMGAEAGQLASEQDRANFAVFMERRRKAFCEPYLLRPFIRSMQRLKILPEVDKPVEFVWPEAFHQNPLERAQTMAQFARAVVNLSRQTQMGFPIATLEEARKGIGLPETPEGELPEAYTPPVDPNKQSDPEGEDGDPTRDPEGEGENARNRGQGQERAETGR